MLVLSGDTMRWSDESPLTFTNWEDGSSPDLALMDTCAVLHTNTRKWEKVSCLDEVENGVVCEAKQGTAEGSGASLNGGWIVPLV